METTLILGNLRNMRLEDRTTWVKGWDFDDVEILLDRNEAIVEYDDDIIAKLFTVACLTEIRTILEKEGHDEEHVEKFIEETEEILEDEWKKRRTV